MSVKLSLENGNMTTIQFGTEDIAAGYTTKKVNVTSDQIKGCVFDCIHQIKNEDIMPNAPASVFNDTNHSCSLIGEGIVISPTATLQTIHIHIEPNAFERRNAEIVLYSILPEVGQGDFKYGKKLGQAKAEQSPIERAFTVFSRQPLRFIVGSRWMKRGEPTRVDPDQVFPSGDLRLE